MATSLPPPARPRRPAPAWPWVLAWAAVGAAALTGVLAILSVGVLVLAVAAPAGVLLAARGGAVARAGAWPGLVAGSAAPLGWLAYLNRGGPGTVCRAMAGGESCTEEWSPWPFAGAAVLALVAGLVVLKAVRARSAGLSR